MLRLLLLLLLLFDDDDDDADVLVARANLYLFCKRFRVMATVFRR